MSKNVLIISSSPRKGGNTEALCQQFAKGATEAGNQVELISLIGKKIAPCLGCGTCQSGACCQKDDAPAILDKMLAADVIVLATPVYFYTMCAQLKALIDRSVMIYPNLTNKAFYYLIAMADTDKKMFAGTLAALRGFLECCEGSQEAGKICALGVYEKGTVQTTPAWEACYQLGRKVS